MDNTKLKMKLALLGVQLAGGTSLDSAIASTQPVNTSESEKYIYMPLTNDDGGSALDSINCGCNGGNCSC